jgi:hypothetical protein
VSTRSVPRLRQLSSLPARPVVVLRGGAGWTLRSLERSRRDRRLARRCLWVEGALAALWRAPLGGESPSPRPGFRSK